MNQEQKWRCAQHLFDSIGQIEDRYVAEAETSYRRAGIGFSRRWVAVAASLTLLVGMTTALLVGNWVGNKSLTENEAALDGFELMDQEIGTVSSLSARLENLRPQTEESRVSAEELDLFDGTARVIWQYADEDGYRVQALTQTELNGLTAQLTKHEGEPVTKATPGSGPRIWIAMGDGTVITPCLTQSAGNVGYGTLFSYEPELEPSPAFSDLLCDILTQSE